MKKLSKAQQKKLLEDIKEAIKPINPKPLVDLNQLTIKKKKK